MFSCQPIGGCGELIDWIADLSATQLSGGSQGWFLAAAARASQSYFTPHEEPSMTYVGIALFGFLGTIIGGGLAIRKRFHIP